MSHETLSTIRSQVLTHFEPEDLEAYRTFEDFFHDVDVQNAYEEGWSEAREGLKPLYRTIFLEVNRHARLNHETGEKLKRDLQKRKESKPGVR